MDLSTTVAIITGGASGLGEATARYLHSLNSKIAIWDINAEKGNSLASEFPNNFVFFETDVTDSSSIASSLSKTISLYEKVTLLVNCAGIAEDSPIATETSIHSMELYEKIIKINLLGTIDVCRQLVNKWLVKPPSVLIIQEELSLMFQVFVGPKGLVDLQLIQLARRDSWIEFAFI